jgi:hypothetical protein
MKRLVAVGKWNKETSRFDLIAEIEIKTPKIDWNWDHPDPNERSEIRRQLKNEGTPLFPNYSNIINNTPTR